MLQVTEPALSQTAIKELFHLGSWEVVCIHLYYILLSEEGGCTRQEQGPLHSYMGEATK